MRFAEVGTPAGEAVCPVTRVGETDVARSEYPAKKHSDETPRLTNSRTQPRVTGYCVRSRNE